MVPLTVYVKCFLNSMPCVQIKQIFLACTHHYKQTLSHYQDSATYQLTLNKVSWVSAAAQQGKRQTMAFLI